MKKTTWVLLAVIWAIVFVVAIVLLTNAPSEHKGYVAAGVEAPAYTSNRICECLCGR